ncbi:MAG TPA: phosphoglycerate kinase [Ktedonobacterales bacterium]|jgi:phosphoglycerate kinase
MQKATIRDADVQGKRVLVRADFNVPLDDARQITDDTRIRAALPTITYLLDHQAAVILMSHLGRPDGQRLEKLSLKPVAERLAHLLGRPVRLAPDCIGPETEQMARALEPGEVLLLENLRFHKEEEKNNPDFARQLASLGVVYINDAFGAAHRAHASTEGIAHILPGYAGFLMEKELGYLGSALENPKRPLVAIIGGAKISDKIGVLDRLLSLADALLIGGAMANTFLKAQGHQVGDSLVEDDKLDEARRIMADARRLGKRFLLPVDVVIADKFAADAASQTVTPDQVSAGWRILDIGPRTVEAFRSVLSDAQTMVFNGTMGVAEFPAFARGTNALIAALADATERGATTIIGGGDSAAAVEAAGAADKMSHVSTGGGASLEFLEGRALPGVVALQDTQ